MAIAETRVNIFYIWGITSDSYVTWKIYLSFVWCRFLFLSSFMVVVDLSKSMTCLHFHTLIYSKYDIVE